MFPNQFDYLTPATLGEATSLLQLHGEEARLMAGGQSLVPMMKLRFLSPSKVIDLRYIRELQGIEDFGEKMRCGAMVRHCDIERSDLIAARIPLLIEAGSDIADVQVRNRGTLGGALCQADPAGDWAVASLALATEMRCVSDNSQRIIPASEFFVDTYTTALLPGEILADVFFKVPPLGSNGVYIKIRKRSGDFAVASVAAQVTQSKKGECIEVGIGVGGVAPKPISPKGIVTFMLGKKLTNAVIRQSCEMLQEYLDPIEDLRGSIDYKRAVAEVALERALNKISSNS